MTDVQPSRGVEKGPASFARGVLTLGGGTALAQALAIAASPLVTRLYAPEAFGLAAVIGTVFAILAPVASGKYDAAVPLPREDEGAASLLGLAFCVLGASALAVALATLALGGPFLRWLGAGAMEPWVWVLPVGVLVAGFGIPLRSWFVRHRRFPTLAGAEIALSGGTSGATVAAGMLGFVAGRDLVFVRLAVDALVSLWLSSRLLRTDWSFLRPHWRREKMTSLARRYVDFPRFTVGVNLLNATSAGLPTLLLAGAFGPAAAGFFALANRILLMPGQLVGASTSQVLFQRAAEMRAHERPAGELLEQLVARLGMFGLAPAMALAIAGPALFGIVFGSEWVEAGRYAAVLSPWVLTMMMAAPLSVLWSVFERQRLALVANVVLLAARLAALAGGARLFDDPGPTLALFAGVSVAFNLFMLGFFGRLTGMRFRRVARQLLRWGLVSALCASLPGVLQHVLSAPPEVVVGGVAVQGILYGLAVLAFDAELRGTAAGWLSRRRE